MISSKISWVGDHWFVIVWILIYIIATKFLHGGLRSDWQKLRIESGLEENSNCIPPKKKDVCSYSGYQHKISCCDISRINMVLSLLIFIVFLTISPVKSFKFDGHGFTQIITTFLYALLFFSSFTSISVNFDMELADNVKLLNGIIKFISQMKRKYLGEVVSKEVKHSKEFIEKTIKEIYTDRLKLGVLVIRLNANFLNKLLDENIDDYESKKIYLEEICLELLNKYKEENPVLLDELIKFLKDKLLSYKVPLYEILKYLDNIEVVRHKQTQSSINKYINEYLPDDKDNNNKKGISKDSVLGILYNSQPNVPEATIPQASSDK